MRIVTPALIAAVLCLFIAPAFAQDSAEPDRPLAEPPHWPYGFKLPAELIRKWDEPKGRGEKMIASKDANVVLWVPEGLEHVRAVFLFSNNTDLVRIGEHKKIREVAAKHGIAIVYLKHLGGNVIERQEPPIHAEQTFQTILELCAKETGLDSFIHAPWITMGKSSRGRFPFRVTWQFPDRVIASISYHGETPTWPMPRWSKVEPDGDSVMHLNIQGLTEWDGTWYRHVRPSLLNYNTQTNWLAHQVVIYGVDHGYYTDYYRYPNWQQRMDKDHKMMRVGTVWDYIALFIDHAMTLRVAEDYQGEAPAELRPVDRASGYLIHPRAIEELHGTKWFAFRQTDAGAYRVIPWPDEVTPVYDKEQGTIDPAKLIVPAKDVPEAERGGYMWVPNQAHARAWLSLHNTYNLKDRVLPADQGE